jgi:hypothetical protein
MPGARGAAPKALDLLHAQVHSVGRTVRRIGAMMVPIVLPTLERVAEQTNLFDLVALAADDGLYTRTSWPRRLTVVR